MVNKSRCGSPSKSASTRRQTEAREETPVLEIGLGPEGPPPAPQKQIDQTARPQAISSVADFAPKLLFRPVMNYQGDAEIDNDKNDHIGPRGEGLPKEASQYLQGLNTLRHQVDMHHQTLYPKDEPSLADKVASNTSQIETLSSSVASESSEQQSSKRRKSSASSQFHVTGSAHLDKAATRTTADMKKLELTINGLEVQLKNLDLAYASTKRRAGRAETIADGLCAQQDSLSESMDGIRRELESHRTTVESLRSSVEACNRLIESSQEHEANARNELKEEFKRSQEELLRKILAEFKMNSPPRSRSGSRSRSRSQSSSPSSTRSVSAGERPTRVSKLRGKIDKGKGRAAETDISQDIDMSEDA